MIHILTIDGRRIEMKVYETKDEIVCDIRAMAMTSAPPFLVEKYTPLSPAQYEHVYAWFNAIISELRENSDKCIHLFDRQHVMTS